MKVFSCLLLFFTTLNAVAQNGKPIIVAPDSSTSIQNPALTRDTLITISGKDTIKVIPKHNPRTATLRSLVLPGWGQAYNRQYWKIPIVYAALGITAGIYIYNNTWYKRTRDAYLIKANLDTPSYNKIHPRLQPLSAQSLQNYRNSFRRDRDYSTLWFIIFWGLNIVDATVYAHLKEFDVSPDLSLKINPVIRQNGNAGFSLVMGLKTPQRHSFSGF